MVNTSVLKFDRNKSPDLYINFADIAAKTNTVSRDLGNNMVTNSWKIAGEIAYPNNMPNGSNTNQYLDVLDANGKILCRFYVAVNRSAIPVVATIFGNKMKIAEGSERDIRVKMDKMVPFEVSIINDTVIFKYENCLPVVTTILDPTGNWKTPKSLRIHHVTTTATGSIYDPIIDLKDFKFYKDFTRIVPLNQPPLVNAGPDQVISLPTSIVNLEGYATDADGPIVSYAWLKIAGPTSGYLSSSTTASTSATILIRTYL